MADSHDFEDFHACHKEKTGINHFLNRVMKSDVKSTSDPESAALKNPTEPQVSKISEKRSAPNVANKKPAVLVDVRSLSSQRTQLLQKMIEACPQGFRVDAEKYEPSEEGALSLNYQYRCL